jgi:thioredoxin-related protein
MKKILILLLTITISLFALGEEVHNFKYETSYYTALKKAKEQNKPIMIMIEKHGCPNCAYMKDIVFERENILNYLNENFISLLLDIHGDYYPVRFISDRAPTFFFIDPKDESEIREKKIGGSRPWKFIQELTEVKNKYDGLDVNITVEDKNTTPSGADIKIVN